MNRDHPILVDIWQRLRQKRNVIVFVESETPDEDFPVLMSWFEPITKDVLSGEDVRLKNGTFLCFRRILTEMPAIDQRVVGEYDVMVIPKTTLLEVKQGLENEI